MLTGMLFLQKSMEHPALIQLKKIVQSIYFRVAASFFFLFLAFRIADITLIVEQLQNVPATVVIALILGNFFFFFLSALRWAVVVSNKNFPISKSLLIKIYIATLLGNFYSLFLPTVIGGDIIKWTAVLDSGLSKKRLMASVFVDRFIGLLSMIFIGVCAVFGAKVFTSIVLPQQVVWFSGALSMGFLGILAWMFGFLQFGRFLPFKQAKAVESFVYDHKDILLKAMGVSIIVQLVSFSMNWIGSMGVGISISLLYVAMFSPLISLILTLPISFSGLGATEASYIFFYSQIGLEPEQILAWTSLGLMIRFVFGIIGWGVAQGLLWAERRG